jgi:hypothetical protein
MRLCQEPRSHFCHRNWHGCFISISWDWSSDIRSGCHTPYHTTRSAGNTASPDHRKCSKSPKLVSLIRKCYQSRELRWEGGSTIIRGSCAFRISSWTQRYDEELSSLHSSHKR